MRRRAALAVLALVGTALLALLVAGDAASPTGGGALAEADPPPVGEGVPSAPAVPLAEREAYTSELDLEDEAARVLEERRERGDCVVARSGYLDLAGRTWGCVLQGSGWAEVVIVSEGDAGGSSVVRLLMDAEDVSVREGG